MLDGLQLEPAEHNRPFPLRRARVGGSASCAQAAPAALSNQHEKSLALQPTDSTWSVRSLLGPVITRLLIYGIDPFDLERTLRCLEATPLLNARQLESTWLAQWDTLAQLWLTRGQQAARNGHRQSARDLGLRASACYLAEFLINPGELSRRRTIYETYVATYRFAADHFDHEVVSVPIPLGNGSSLAALLHLPFGKGPHPCAAVLSGMGSCKEEMNTLARLLVARGIAALVPDMPGSGETLFREGISCGSEPLSLAYAALADFAESHPAIDATRFGALGLCMGGGFAYRACAEQSRYQFCATLFPLFLNAMNIEIVPQWMKGGEWYSLQTGNKTEAEIHSEIGWRDSLMVACPFLMIHGKHDNWMTLEHALKLYENASSPLRELVVVEQAPAYSMGQSLLHTMPVGEQIGWTGPLVADWIAERTRLLPAQATAKAVWA